MNLLSEKRLLKRTTHVVGIDEVGRGALAGPVVATAVCISNCANLDKELILKTNDSKKLLPEQRKYINLLARRKRIKFSIGRASQTVIDRKGIQKATSIAMYKAVKKLKLTDKYLLFDGNYVDRKLFPEKNIRTVVKGDGKIFCIALASVIAKVYRDKIMIRLHKKYPRYRFDIHKGYGTRKHIAALKRYGASPFHRKAFVKSAIENRI